VSGGQRAGEDRAGEETRRSAREQPAATPSELGRLPAAPTAAPLRERIASSLYPRACRRRAFLSLVTRAHSALFRRRSKEGFFYRSSTCAGISAPVGTKVAAPNFYVLCRFRAATQRYYAHVGTGGIIMLGNPGRRLDLRSLSLAAGLATALLGAA